MSDFLEVSLLPWIGKSGKLLHAYISEIFKENKIDITLEQFVILRKLSLRDGVSQRDISIATKRHKATMTKALNSLERKYLVARIPDPNDMRVNCIHLTTLGRKKFDSAVPIMEEAIVKLQDGITQREINTLIGIMKKFQQNIAKHPKLSSSI